MSWSLLEIVRLVGNSAGMLNSYFALLLEEMSHSSSLFGDERLFLQLLGPFVCNSDSFFLDLVVVNLIPLVIGVFNQCCHFFRIQSVETIVEVDFVTSFILWQLVTKQISYSWKQQCF